MKIEAVQRAATRRVRGLKGLSYPERLRELNLPSLLFRREREDINYVHNFSSKYDIRQLRGSAKRFFECQRPQCCKKPPRRPLYGFTFPLRLAQRVPIRAPCIPSCTLWLARNGVIPNGGLIDFRYFRYFNDCELWRSSAEEDQFILSNKRMQLSGKDT